MRLVRNVFLSCAIGSTLFITGCLKDNKIVELPPSNNSQEELVTTFQLYFTDTANINPNLMFEFKDIDGVGGMEPSQFDSLSLVSNTVYHCQVVLLNESVFPIDSISNEVLHEGEEHLMCYTVMDANCNVTLTDSDGNLPIGLRTQWTVGSAGNGSVTITLKHQPGIKDGSCSIGETDVELDFIIIIQ